MPISREHRPVYFRDVTGQEHITETLRKEVETGILGHAFLLSGPRGVGKTTTARIFAKALLSESTDKGEPDPKSEAVQEIDRGACIDFIEMDAASHTGVDHVREAIVEHVRFPPVKWKRKVYVIDECHMLSASAWNAMLKTLEEPPVYAFFILATTELHKVPETIKSRCQRFEFRRVSHEALAKRIRSLATAEGVKLDESVVHSIVHASDGCVRDAENLLDQLSSLGTGTVTEAMAELVLPVSHIQESVELLEAAGMEDLASCLGISTRLRDEGLQEYQMIEDMLVVIRKLIQCESPDIQKEIEQGNEEEKSILRLKDVWSREELGKIALMLLERRRDIKSGVDPGFALELALVALSSGALRDTQTSADSEKNQMKPEQPLKAQHNTELKTELPIQKESALDIHDVRTKWNQIIRHIESKNPSLPFILKVTRPERLDGLTLILEFEYVFHFEKIINDVKTKRIVEASVREIIKHDSVIIDGIVRNGDDKKTDSRKDIVSKVLDQFGGDVVS